MRFGPSGRRLATRLLIVAMLAFSATTARAETAIVAVAANFMDALTELAKTFEAETGHTLKMSSGSSGHLYAQIVNGAPYDVFLSADEESPRRLEVDGLTVQGSRFTYAIGQLVMWQPKAVAGCAGGPPCTGSTVKSLAIANPALAPYGRAAEQVLRARPDWPEIKPKLVFGQNIAQTYAMIATGNADAGIVARAQIDPSGDNLKGSAMLVDPQRHDPIRQDAVFLKRAADNPAAAAFMAFLKSAGARKIIADFGYLDGDE